MSIDLDKLVAIDVHTHAHRNADDGREDPVANEFLQAAAK